ncbi:sensor histidine kinase [Bradyrhizobium ottawaense]|uniref:sensor histidine kinase n=1 Tax=Bradyrhizobium ottawaense TaxID=931866 RepID=UPI003518817D
MLQNLLHNAIKYTAPRDPAIITISGHEDANSTTYIVADNGVGFEMKYVDKLFGVFQRLHRAEEFEGTGIGLALAKRILDRHGGSISAEGKVGAGASLTFTLPRPKDLKKRSS